MFTLIITTAQCNCRGFAITEYYDSAGILRNITQILYKLSYFQAQPGLATAYFAGM